MPIKATYQVQCDECFGYLDGEHDTQEAAERARTEAKWEDGYGTTICLGCRCDDC